MKTSVSAIHRRFHEERAQDLRPLISEDLISAWIADPSRAHREPMSWIMRFLDRRPTSERVTIYEAEAGHRWQLVHPPAERGQTYRLADRRTFDDLDAAREACLRRELYDALGWGEAPSDAVDGPEVDTQQPVLLGYADRISVSPGEQVTFMVSAEGVREYTTELVKLRHIDDNPRGPGRRTSTVHGQWSGRHPGQVQHTQLGAHITVADPDRHCAGTDGFSLAAYIYPTVETGTRQVVIARWSQDLRGYALGLDEECRLTLWLGNGAHESAYRLPDPVQLHAWHGIAASYDATSGRVALTTKPQVSRVNSRMSPIVVPEQQSSATYDGSAAFAPADGADLLFAAMTPTSGHFNGKIESPGIWPSPVDDATLTTAAARDHDAPLHWWFGPSTDPSVPDTHTTTAAALTVRCTQHPELNGRLVNMPVRGVTGRHYDGVSEHYARDPHGYAAIHFHDDALTDSAWEPSHVFTVPDDTESGVYALQLQATDGSCERAVPFVVRPRPGTTTGDIALLMPTATYLAYSNERGLGYVGLVPDGTALLEKRYDLGHSHYASHTDGSGVCYTSWRRPILTVSPGYRIHLSPFTLTSDLYIVDWLSAHGYSYDVITDHDLHAEGPALLRGYRAVLSGSHPEYASEQMLDAIEDYVDEGGNFGYLGGNGYYWIVSFHPELPHVMELRRGENGTRSWQSRPGEHHHATTGERGGLWALRGRAPQKVFGVGFSAQGGQPGGYYRTIPDLDSNDAHWLLDGVPEAFGDPALEPGGAAGNEIDRYDPRLGSPPDAVVVASSRALSDSYQFAVEELGGTHPGNGATENPDVRSDIVYFRTRGGGSVFSTGSISFSSGLSAQAYDNGISRITRNVLDHWLADKE